MITDDGRDMEMEVEAKILHLLSIYPIISPTMLQSGLGPYTKPALWRPVLTRLITEGKVIEDQESLQTPSERYNTYTKLSLPLTTVSIGHAHDG
jgi:hypothetical protein